MLATVGVVGGHLRDRADAPVAWVREEVRDHLVPLGVDAGRQRACLRDELVDAGDVEALRELLLVAQEDGHVVPESRSTWTTG